jgi:hypothetical protein
MLATRQQVKDRMKLLSTDTEWDAVIDVILRNVSDMLAREAGRVVDGVACLEKATVVETFSPDYDDTFLWLTARPVVSITSITEAVQGAHSTATPLVNLTDYYASLARGRLIRVGRWLAGAETVQVTYVGGYVLAIPWVAATAYVAGDVVTYLGTIYECILLVSGSTAPAADATHWTPRAAWTASAWVSATSYIAGNAVSKLGILYSCILAVSGTTAPAADPTHWAVIAQWAALPGDINEAAIQQTQFYFTRRLSIGQSSGGIQGASSQSYAQDDLLPGVRETMRRYARVC